jgi:hypothetical protein
VTLGSLLLFAGLIAAVVLRRGHLALLVAGVIPCVLLGAFTMGFADVGQADEGDFVRVSLDYALPWTVGVALGASARWLALRRWFRVGTTNDRGAAALAEGRNGEGPGRRDVLFLLSIGGLCASAIAVTYWTGAPILPLSLVASVGALLLVLWLHQRA